jgi:hypothetical protein
MVYYWGFGVYGKIWFIFLKGKPGLGQWEEWGLGFAAKASSRPLARICGGRGCSSALASGNRRSLGIPFY